MKSKSALAATFESGILLPPLVTSPPSTATYVPLMPVPGKKMEPYAGEHLFFQANSDAASGVLTLTVSDRNVLGPTDASAKATQAQLTVKYLGASMASNLVPVNWPGGPIDFSVMLNGDRSSAFLQFEPRAKADDTIPNLGFVILEEEDPVGAATSKLFFISNIIPVEKYAQRPDVTAVEPAGGIGLLGPMGIDFGAPQ